MKRYIAALIAAVMMIGMLAAPAMAAPEPEPCVPGVEVSSLTDPETNNIVRVTVTVTCNEDGTLDDISVTREVLQYWVPSKRDGRAGGHYETPDQRYAPPAPFRVCGPARAWNVCS